MSDSADKTASFDPSEFTARELQLARQFLGLLRRHRAADTEIALVVEGDQLGLLWSRATGQSPPFRTGPTLTYNCSSTLSGSEGSPWPSTTVYDGPPGQSSQADSLPQPDAVIEPPEDNEPQQP